MQTFLAKLRTLFAPQQDDREFSEEIQTHIALLTDRMIARGMPREEAAEAARRQFGNTSLHHQHRRDLRSFLVLATLARDLRFAARQLQRNPLITLIAIASLALGIGANTAIFSVAKRVLFDTLPVRDPQQLRILNWTSGPPRPVPPVWGDIWAAPGGGLVSNAFSYPVYEALRQHPEAFESILAFKDVSLTATVDNTPNLATAELLSGGAFDTLGIAPILGRSLTPADDAVGATPVALISDAFWTQHFARSPSVLGQTIALNGAPVTIVGVAPASFNGLDNGTLVQLFVPIAQQPQVIPRAQNGSVSLLDNPQSWWLQIMIRLRPGVPESQAQTQAQIQLDLAFRHAAQSIVPSAKAMETLHLRLEPGSRGADTLHGEFAQPSYLLLALSGLVLLLACVNLANLLLARAASRQREMSTRLALGARRSHILRQMLTESLLLSTLGGAAGLALGYIGRNAIPRMIANPTQSAALHAAFDWQVLAFTAAVSIVTGILFGLIPAWQATRTNLTSAMKDSNQTTSACSRLNLGKGLVVFQIALSTILLIGAALFVRTLLNLNNTPLGFRADHLLLFRLNPPRIRYTDARMNALYRQLQEKLAAIPGVRSVSFSVIAVIGDGHSGSTFHHPGFPDQPTRVQTNRVGGDFFATMGIPILQGRSFNSTDTPKSPIVAVINRALAQQFFPNQNPIGQIFEADPDEATGPIQIIGVAADTRYADLRTPTPPTFYLSDDQGLEAGRIVAEIRTQADPAGILAQVRAVVASFDRDLPLIDVRTMQEQIASTLSNERIFAQLTAAFGLLALILACIGIYGIMAYTVSRRTSEIGIRMALGAQASQVLKLVLSEVSWMATAGIALGIASALWLSRFIAAMLYGLQSWDPITLVSVAAILIVIALLAGYGPARRASKINPTQALRHD
jgi:predicted permease